MTENQQVNIKKSPFLDKTLSNDCPHSIEKYNKSKLKQLGLPQFKLSVCSFVTVARQPN